MVWRQINEARVYLTGTNHLVNKARKLRGQKREFYNLA